MLNALCLCQEALAAPGAAVLGSRESPLSLQCPEWLESLGQCWEDAQGHHCVRAVPPTSHQVLRNRLRPVFPRAPLVVF